MDGKRILLALGDREDLASESEYLKEKGFDVLSASDGAAALEIALREKPSLIIVELDLPVVDGERIFQILRNNPNTAEMPFIFIGSETVDIRGFRVDIDFLLLRPLKDEELLRTINNIFTMGKEGLKAAIGDKEIEGRLSHISLGDLLQILHLNRKEGMLKISHEDKEGSIYIKEGNIYNAVMGDIEKEKALFRLLSWHDGKFEFSPKPVEVLQKIHRSTGNLLMEGMRQYDEWNKAKDQLPKTDSSLKLKVDISTLPKGLKPIIYEVLFLVDFYPLVGDLVNHCTFPDYEVYQTLAGLLRKGVLEEMKDMRTEAKKAGELKEILTSSQALKLREKISGRWKDMKAAPFGKILIVSTNDDMVISLMDSCKELPGFSVNKQFITSPIHRENPLGGIATLKVHSGMDVILFAVPLLSMKMQPLWKAFSNNMVGMIMLCDKKGIQDVQQLASTKNYILSLRRIPVIHTLTLDHGMDRKQEEEFRKVLGMKRDEQIFIFEPANRDKIYQIFNAFFGYILKDEYILSYG